MTTQASTQASIQAPKNRNNIVLKDLNDYETLYQVDFNFDIDVNTMDDNVLSNYITRVLSSHPYYIDVNNIVDIVVNNNENTISVVVSTQEVRDKINQLTNNPITLNQINNISPKVNNKSLNIISSMIPKKKFMLERRNNDKTTLYEYEFNGFEPAKDLYHRKSVSLNGNKTRHYLRNNQNASYFYNTYNNSHSSSKQNVINNMRNIVEASNNVDNLSNISNNTNLTTDNIISMNVGNNYSIEPTEPIESIDENDNNEELELEELLQKLNSLSTNNIESSYNNYLIFIAIIIFLLLLIFIVYFIYNKNILIITNK
jgi:hypothetical protein